MTRAGKKKRLKKLRLPALRAGIVRGPKGWPKGWPERSLGSECVRWCYRYLRQPDGPRADEPWEFTPQQARIVDRFYALDELGTFVYTDAVVRMMTG